MPKKMNRFQEDLFRRTGGDVSFLSFLKEFFVPQYKVVFLKRLCEYFYENIRFLYPVVYFIYRQFKIRYGCDIPAKVLIGKGLKIGHIGGIVINPNVKIGNNVDILNGVLIGESYRGKKKGCPVIGNNVWIGTNVAIVGNITIGDDVLIAPNTLVSESVPSHSLVCGNPMSIYPRENATYAFIINKV